MISTEKLWGKVLGELEVEVSKANFLTLFKQTYLLSLDGNVATVAVPNAMIIDLLQRKFFNLIKTSVDKHTGQDTKIIFVPKTIADNVVKKDVGGGLFSEPETKKAIGHLPRVRAEYTFENMAVSSSNQLAFVSATTVAKTPGQTYNPLFMYGPVGVGKTHLMQAIANEVYIKNPSAKILYTTSEEFTNDVVEAIRTNNTSKMKRRFRELSLLIIDDIQFIAGKEKVQEELFHTFNTLVDGGSQIVLSSDRPPSEIKKVEQRLTSRFSGGLTVDIQSPDFELRTAILLIKAKKYNVSLNIDIAKLIAEKAQDARSLEGILLKVITLAQAGDGDINEEIVSSVLSLDKSERKHTFHPDDIIDNVCSFYNIKTTQIKSPKRDAFLVKPRQVAMFLLKKRLNLTYVEIGNLLGGRDHTTVMHGVEKVETMLKTGSFNEDIMGISSNLSEKNVN